MRRCRRAGERRTGDHILSYSSRRERTHDDEGCRGAGGARLGGASSLAWSMTPAEACVHKCVSSLIKFGGTGLPIWGGERASERRRRMRGAGSRLRGGGGVCVSREGRWWIRTRHGSATKNQVFFLLAKRPVVTNVTACNCLPSPCRGGYWKERRREAWKQAPRQAHLYVHCVFCLFVPHHRLLRKAGHARYGEIARRAFRTQGTATAERQGETACRTQIRCCMPALCACLMRSEAGMSGSTFLTMPPSMPLFLLSSAPLSCAHPPPLPLPLSIPYAHSQSPLLALQ